MQATTMRGHGRKYHKSVVHIPGVVPRLGNIWYPISVPLPNSSRKNPTITRIRPYPIPLPIPSRNAGQGRLLSAKALKASHYDAVGDDEADKDGECLADLIVPGLEHLVHDHHQSGHHHKLDNDSDRLRDCIAQERYYHIGQAESTAVTETAITRAGLKFGCDCERGTYSEHLTITGLSFDIGFTSGMNVFFRFICQLPFLLRVC